MNKLIQNGLQADFYFVDGKNNFAFTEHKGVYVDANMVFPSVSDALEVRAGRTDYVGAVWTGRLVVPETANYSFHAISDNGLRLYVGDMKTPIIDWWVNEWDKEQTSDEMLLEEGKIYEFKYEWFQAEGGAYTKLSWSNDKSMDKMIIPPSVFFLPETFKGPMITSVDISNASLNLQERATGGTLTVNGLNLKGAVMKGTSLNPLSVFEVAESSETKLVLKVPADLKAGMFSVQISNNGIVNTTNELIYVLPAKGENLRPEHPRPDWMRSEWVNLNGWWDFSFDDRNIGLDEKWYIQNEYDYKINVPFCWESELSGIRNTTYRGVAWYEREVDIKENWNGKEIFLKFGAVDAISKIYVNGILVKENNGGYAPIEVNITGEVKSGINKITVRVEDKASYGDESYPALVGKQGHNAPCGYTHTSGIWQTVYMEAREKTYLDYAFANPDPDNSAVQYNVKINSSCEQEVSVKYDFKSIIWNETLGEDVETGSVISTLQEGISLKTGENIIRLAPVIINDQKLWNFDSPNLYSGRMEIISKDGNVLDSVETYFGQRKISVGKYDGREYDYIYINNKPVFLSGLLDQGFWAQGIYTAPSAGALKYDIKAMRDRDFNMIRKHLKLEDPIQYYWADKLGMFVWADMPHATYMNAREEGGEAPGRIIYENTLDKMLVRDYNHPAIIAIMLFNETWGINHNGPEADDGMTTHEWMIHLYNKVKKFHPDLLTEEMSPCNFDHIQPTDLNTFHMYPKGYRDSKNFVADREKNVYKGSKDNFWGDFVQETDPWLNSEYGGVAAYDKDWDVSWCFKYQTDIQRQYQKLNGYVYTEPFDVEYERNGILTYDRRNKVFGYSEVAYGGDMDINDLNHTCYVGIDADPVMVLKTGDMYEVPAIALNWSGKEIPGTVMKWRFDATDIYGNNFTTGIKGQFDIAYAPYTREERNIEFKLPDIRCVGTVTVWIEDHAGRKITKNFVNVIAENKTEVKDPLVLRKNADAFLKNTIDSGTGEIVYEYELPQNFDISSLKSMRLLAEASSLKNETLNLGIVNSAYSQTTVGSERASDMTVSVNGVEIDTVLLPDNLRDIRGTLTLPKGLNGGSSAGNFGYLVDINIPVENILSLRDKILRDGKISVSYSVKPNAVNKNGLIVYAGDTGRYMTEPTVIINPKDVYAEGNSFETDSMNYTVEINLNSGDYVNVRGDNGYRVENTGKEIILKDADNVLGCCAVSGAAFIKIKLFDDHIQVFKGNDPVSVIDVFDYSSYTGGVTANVSGFVVKPESY